MTLSKEPATVERLAQRKKKVANNKEIEQEMEKYLEEELREFEAAFKKEHPKHG